MAGPLYNNIAGTVTASPTTGSFTPTGAYTGSIAWTSLPTGIYPYRADGAAGWEIGFTLWNGTTLTRGPLFSSNSNAAVSFSTDVVVQLTNISERIQTHLGTAKWGMWYPTLGGGLSAISLGAPTASGTAGSVTTATTNMLTRFPRIQYTQAAVANGVAGVFGAGMTQAGLFYSTDTNDIGFELVCRFGFGTLPVNPRIFIGGGNAGLSTVEPSTLNNTLFFGKDSTDTNWQFVRRSASATTKIDLGFAPATGIPYEITISKNPGNKDVIAMLFCLDGSQVPFVQRIAAGSANLPANNSNFIPGCQLALNGTDTGAAALIYLTHLFFRSLV